MVVSVKFPSKPKVVQVPSVSASSTFGAATIYQVAGVSQTYQLIITAVNSNELAESDEQTILGEYFNSLSVGKEKVYGYARMAMIGAFNGQTADLKNKTHVLHGKYFLTSNGIIAVMVKELGQQPSTAALDFVDSLSIELTNTI